MKIIRLAEMPNPYPRPAIPAAQLDAARHATIAVLAPLRLLGALLTPIERKRCGPCIDQDCATVVQAVGRGLRDQAALFPDIAQPGADLLVKQAEAEAAQHLWRCLSYYADLARDHYLATQAECTAVGREVVRHVQQDPLDLASRLQRLTALGAAPRLMDRRNEAIRRSKRASRRALPASVVPGGRVKTSTA